MAALPRQDGAGGREPGTGAGSGALTRYAAIGIATACFIAAVALYVSGQPVPAAIAAVLGVVLDVLFVLAIRADTIRRRNG